MPASGNLGVAGRQFWLGPDRAGVTVTFWADSQVIHLLIAGTRIKSLRSHLSTHDLELLAASGGRPAGRHPCRPPDPDNGAAEADRTVNAAGLVSLAGRQVLAVEILPAAGSPSAWTAPPCRCSTPTAASCCAPPQPTQPAQTVRFRGAGSGGPPPQALPSPGPKPTPGRQQRRDHGRRPADPAGRTHAGQVVTIHANDATLTIDLGDDTTTIRRTTTRPVGGIKAHWPRNAGYVS